MILLLLLCLVHCLRNLIYLQLNLWELRHNKSGLGEERTTKKKNKEPPQSSEWEPGISVNSSTHTLDSPSCEFNYFNLLRQRSSSSISSSYLPLAANHFWWQQAHAHIKELPNIAASAQCVGLVSLKTIPSGRNNHNNNNNCIHLSMLAKPPCTRRRLSPCLAIHIEI